jgi:hypothetical protein
MPPASEAAPPAPATEDQWQVGRLVALGFIGLFLGLSPFYAGLFDLGLWAPCALVVIAIVVALFVAGVRPTGWPAVAAVIALTAFAGWTWLSTLWANDPGAAEIDAARYTFYAAALTLVACLLRGRRSGMVLLGAATAGVLVVAVDVLSRMLFGDGPGLFIAGRLNDPLGYVNGEAVAFLMAIWPLIAVAEQVRRPWLAAPAAGLAAILTCLVVLSQSRGAALGAVLGVVALVVLVPGRQPRVWLLLVLAAVVAVLGQPVLDLYGTVSNNEAVAEGTVLSAGGATLLVGLATMIVWGAATGIVAWARAQSPEGADTMRRVGAIVLIAGAVLAVVAGVALSGRIADKVNDQYDSFVNLGSDQGNGSRLTAGGGNRYDFWRVALNEFSDHPLEGVGAGNYPADYFLQRRQDQDISQPHSLPLQTLAELGLVGGVLLLAFVAAAVAGLWRRARRRTVADTALAVAAGGAFLGWLGASLVDWIHLFPGLAAIALGAVAVLTVDDEAVPRPTTGGSRLALAGVVGLLAVLASVGIATIGLADRYHNAASAELASDPVQALSDTTKSLDLNDDATETYYTRAAAYARLGRYPEARQTLQTALAKSPDNFVTWTLLGDLAFRRRNLRSARQYYSRALLLNPQNGVLRKLARDPAA